MLIKMAKIVEAFSLQTFFKVFSVKRNGIKRSHHCSIVMALLIRFRVQELGLTASGYTTHV